MTKEYRALTGISYRDADGKELSLDRGDSVPAAVIDAAPWLLEDLPGRGAAAEDLTVSLSIGVVADHDFIGGPTADHKEE